MNSPTEPSQRPAPQETLGQAGRRDPFRYGKRIQVIDIKSHRNIFLLDPHGYFQSVRGSFHHRDIVDMDEGNVIETDIGHGLFLLRLLLTDYVLSMPRGVQVIYPKDSGQVIAMGDISPGTQVLRAGVGSGVLTMNLLSAAGEADHLLSIEHREDLAQIAASNVDAWFGRHHPAWELCTRGFVDVVAAQVEPGSIDRVILDMLAPWENVEATSQALVPDGLFLAYMATTVQLSHTVEVLRRNGLFIEPKSQESMVRTWNVDGFVVRPDHRVVAYTGFLLTARRLAADSRPLTRERPSAYGAYNEDGYWLPDDVKEHTSTDEKVRRVLRDYRAKQPSDATPVLSGDADDDQGGVDHA